MENCKEVSFQSCYPRCTNGQSCIHDECVDSDKIVDIKDIDSLKEAVYINNISPGLYYILSSDINITDDRIYFNIFDFGATFNGLFHTITVKTTSSNNPLTQCRACDKWSETGCENWGQTDSDCGILFQYLGKGSIKNLYVNMDVTFDSNVISMLGVIAGSGYEKGESTIQNLACTGHLSLDSNQANAIGGCIGVCGNTSIDNMACGYSGNDLIIESPAASICFGSKDSGCQTNNLYCEGEVIDSNGNPTSYHYTNNRCL